VSHASPDWRRIRAKHLYRVIDERAGDESLPLLAVSIHHGVVPRESLTGDEPRAEDLSSYKRCAAGDVVLNRMRAFQGAVGVAPQAGIVSPDYVVLRMVDGVDVRFFHHLFRSTWFVAEITARLRGIGSSNQGNVRTPRINVEDFGDIFVAMPPLHLQREIAGFLDDEATRLEALVEKKRRAIALLDERRRSVIDGLTVPRALGGSADIGSTPWPVTALKRSAAFFNDGDWIESPFITSDGIRLIQTGNVGEGEYRDQGFRFISEETFTALKCTEVFPGDVLISRLAGPVGCACLAPHLGSRMIAAVDVAILRPSPDVDAGFVVAYLSSARHLALAELLARGTTLQRLSRSQVGDMPLPLPELRVQQAIAEKVATATSALKPAKSRLERQIALLREHHRALITAAVTGKLDVSEAAA
jgi:type I restriction enzyme, S subunit